MKETIDLTWKELCGELRLRQKGKVGEWDIPTKMLMQLWTVKMARIPMGITRNAPDELVDPMKEKGWIG